MLVLCQYPQLENLTVSVPRNSFCKDVWQILSDSISFDIVKRSGTLFTTLFTLFGFVHWSMNGREVKRGGTSRDLLCVVHSKNENTRLAKRHLAPRNFTMRSTFTMSRENLGSVYFLKMSEQVNIYNNNK